jgi:hypothetical protein
LIPGGVGYFSLLHNDQIVYRCCFPGGKAARREADRSPQSAAEDKSGAAIAPLARRLQGLEVS